jgi:membrane fusion protein
MTSLSLFRSESVEGRRRRLHGDVILAQPLAHTLLTLTLGAVMAGVIAFLALGTYPRTATVRGYFAPDGGLAQIHAPRGGVVDRVFVGEGDRVEAGQPLVTLTLDTRGVGGAVGERARAEAERQLAELDLQIAATAERLDLERGRLADRIEGIAAELERLDARRRTEAALLALYEEDAARAAGLARTGTVTIVEVQRRRQIALSQEASLAELDRQIVQRRNDLRDLRAALVAQPVEARERLAQLRAARADLQGALAERELGEGYVVVAPVAGRVAALDAAPGQPAQAQRPLIAIVPVGRPLMVHLLVPTQAGGWIEPGQPVRMRVDAFPFQRFGTVDGHVVQVPSAAYRPGDFIAPIPFEEPVYRVVVDPARRTVEGYGERRDLVSGMTLTADVVIERRTFLDAILDPLRAARLRTEL